MLKAARYFPEVKEVFNNYHKELTGNYYIPGVDKPFDFIHVCSLDRKSMGEILYLMYTAGYESGYKKGLKYLIGELLEDKTKDELIEIIRHFLDEREKEGGSI